MVGLGASVAEHFAPVLSGLIGSGSRVGLRFWDGSVLSPAQPAATLVLASPLAVRYLLWAPGELGVARAYVSGELEVEGDVYAALSVGEALARHGRDGTVKAPGRLTMLGLARRLGAIGPPPARPAEEARLSGRRHSPARDAAAIAYHYDISNEFYRLVLGPTMTYSCAYFSEERLTLEEAQAAKYDLICRKLGLGPGSRLLDVGCGWGGMVLHAAEHYGAYAVGVTISARQAELAKERVAAAGLEERVEIRLQDYRDISDGPYDAISSIGMFEHVGLAKLREYFNVLRALLRDGGRLLNHAISRPSGSASAFRTRSFIDRYVFPDGELLEVGTVISALQECGLEARDVECLREHYERTLRAWVANLEARLDEAISLVGEGRTRVWRLYMAASAMNFAANRMSVHQVLAVRTAPGGASGMPPTRADLLGEPALSRASG